jgi:hypothetical protein
MVNDMNKPYEYPFDPPTEEAVAMSDGAVDGRPMGVPSSYDRGKSVSWTP